MKKIILIPDSFKGTMSSTEICDIMSSSIKNHHPDVEIVKIPVADGGEGTVDAFLSSVGGEKVFVEVNDPYFNKINAYYGMLSEEKTAIIEMATAAGLPLVGDNMHAEKTTTFGVGEIINDAINKGVTKLIIALGGSATNEGGCGAAAALGVKFYNNKKESFVPVGETLIEIENIDLSEINPKLSSMEIIVMCDIDNPLCGENGASAIFGPQKGADKNMVKQLDAGLNHLASIIKRDIGADILNIKGSGAAGGMGGGMIAFLNAKLEMGIETLLNTVNFDKKLDDADLVFSGEGKIDNQSLRGKVVIGVARRTKAKNVPLIAVVGDIGDNIQKAYDEGVTSIISINRVCIPFSEAKLRAKSDLSLTIDNIIRLLNIH